MAVYYGSEPIVVTSLKTLWSPVYFMAYMYMYGVGIFIRAHTRTGVYEL